MNTQLASCLQGAAVGALVTLLAAKIRRGMTWRHRPPKGPARGGYGLPIGSQTASIALGDIPAGAPVSITVHGGPPGKRLQLVETDALHLSWTPVPTGTMPTKKFVQARFV
jgi:hypothetical protein